MNASVSITNLHNVSFTSLESKKSPQIVSISGASVRMSHVTSWRL